MIHSDIRFKEVRDAATIVSLMGLVLLALSFEVTVSAARCGPFQNSRPVRGGSKDAPKTFEKTASGLKYRVLRQGAGAKPKPANTVKVNSHGWLDNGKVFDSSYSRKEPISFHSNMRPCFCLLVPSYVLLEDGS